MLVVVTTFVEVFDKLGIEFQRRLRFAILEVKVGRL